VDNVISLFSCGYDTIAPHVVQKTQGKSTQKISYMQIFLGKSFISSLMCHCLLHISQNVWGFGIYFVTLPS
jgi:hypothetical protein